MGNRTKALIISLTLMFVRMRVYHSATVLLASSELNVHLKICLGPVWQADTLYQYFVYSGGKRFWTPHAFVIYCIALRISLQAQFIFSAVTNIHTHVACALSVELGTRCFCKMTCQRQEIIWKIFYNNDWD